MIEGVYPLQCTPAYLLVDYGPHYCEQFFILFCETRPNVFLKIKRKKSQCDYVSPYNKKSHVALYTQKMMFVAHQSSSTFSPCLLFRLATRENKRKKKVKFEEEV